MATDPELRRLYLEARAASERLVTRLEGYGDLVPGRPAEAKLGDDVSGHALLVERQFRGWYERTRNLREMLEDPDLKIVPPFDPDRSPPGE